jgi:hypothetical protein
MNAVKDEQTALLANDIKVLASQLNEKVEAAARAGLEVDLQATACFYMQPRALKIPKIEVRILAEVQ